MDDFLVQLQAIVDAAEMAADDVDVFVPAYADDEAFIACQCDLVDIFGE